MAPPSDFSGGGAVRYKPLHGGRVGKRYAGLSCGLEHVGVGLAHEVGIYAVGDAGVSEVLALGAVAGDAHDDASGHSGGFLQGAECAAGGVRGDVFGDACGGGYGGEVVECGAGGEGRRHVEIVAAEYLDGEGGEGYLHWVVGLVLYELHIVLAIG